jgi:transcription elongation factor SPT6
LEDKENEWKPRKDPHYDFESEAEDKVQNDTERKKAQAKQSYVKRVIVHPNFKNIEYKRAEKLLDNLEKDKSEAVEIEYQQGDVIIRPSSKVLIFKCFGFCFVVVRIYVSLEGFFQNSMRHPI